MLRGGFWNGPHGAPRVRVSSCSSGSPRGVSTHPNPQYTNHIFSQLYLRKQLRWVHKQVRRKIWPDRLRTAAARIKTAVPFDSRSVFVTIFADIFQAIDRHLSVCTLNFTSWTPLFTWKNNQCQLSQLGQPQASQFSQISIIYIWISDNL